MRSPGGLATLKTLLDASTPERPIEAYLFEAYVEHNVHAAQPILLMFDL